MPAKITATERLQVTFWRGVMGVLALGGGKAVPGKRVTVHRFGPGKLEMLDHWHPAPGTPRRPVVVHIHGGGWIAGSKGRFYTKPLARLADAGHPVFSLNYPLAPETQHPEPLRALLRGLVWIKRTQGDGAAVHLLGDSAGGNLAMMLAILLSDPEALHAYDKTDPALLPGVASVISIYGVMDRITWQEDRFPAAALFLKSYAGVQALAADFQTPMPLTPMDMGQIRRLPRTFIAAGDKDKLARSSRIFFDRLIGEFPETEYKLYPGADHGFFNFGTGHDELLADLVTFLDRN